MPGRPEARPNGFSTTDDAEEHVLQRRRCTRRSIGFRPLLTNAAPMCANTGPVPVTTALSL